jgi:predicted TIM-barrel fold metal-dependent hydrolase
MLRPGPPSPVADLEARFSVPIVLDHFAYPTSPLTHSSSPPGLASLLHILSIPTSQLYVKISAPYRLVPPFTTPAGLRPLFEALFRAGSNRLIFGSDWPHTRFDGYDTVNWITTIVKWCLEMGGEEAVEKVFKTNAEGLWRGAREVAASG